MAEFGRIVRQESAQDSNPYEPTWKEILRAKWDAMPESLREIADYSELMADLYGFDGPFMDHAEFRSNRS